MNTDNLIKAESIAKDMLVNSIKEFVREHGEDCNDYYVNEFGLNEDDNGEGHVCKVFNFYDNGGCFFFEPEKLNMDGLEDIDEHNYYRKLYENVAYSAYQCLYIVVDKENEEHLKYYRFTNGGVNFDDDLSEPDHDDACSLSLLDLHYLIEAIKGICK